MISILLWALLTTIVLTPLGYAVYRARPAARIERMARQLYPELFLPETRPTAREAAEAMWAMNAAKPCVSDLLNTPVVRYYPATETWEPAEPSGDGMVEIIFSEVKQEHEATAGECEVFYE